MLVWINTNEKKSVQVAVGTNVLSDGVTCPNLSVVMQISKSKEGMQC